MRALLSKLRQFFTRDANQTDPLDAIIGTPVRLRHDLHFPGEPSITSAVTGWVMRATGRRDEVEVKWPTGVPGEGIYLTHRVDDLTWEDRWEEELDEDDEADEFPLAQEDVALVVPDDWRPEFGAEIEVEGRGPMTISRYLEVSPGRFFIRLQRKFESSVDLVVYAGEPDRALI